MILDRLKRTSLIMIIIIVLISGCGKKEENKDGLLVRLGDEKLTQDEVISLIPPGIHPSDSIKLFHNIVEEWIKDKILTDFAADRLLDTSKIDRMVRDYHNKLIIEEYLRKMSASQSPITDEKSVKEYYAIHKKDLKIELPLIKGVFLKVNSETKGKEEISKLMSTDEDSNIDVLEKSWIDKALAYEYFKDRWIDWETVSGLIPFRFGDPDKFLENNKYFETEYGDCTYYLLITDYLPGGSEQPYEYASLWISKLLSQVEISKYERTLVESLILKSIKENKLEIIGYDPINKAKIIQE